MKCVESLGKREFTLDEVYAFDRHLGDSIPATRTSGRRFVSSCNFCAIGDLSNSFLVVIIACDPRSLAWLGSSTSTNAHRCRRRWIDEWSCMCDDICPHCGARHMTPYRERRLDDDHRTGRQAIHRVVVAGDRRARSRLSRASPFSDARQGSNPVGRCVMLVGQISSARHRPSMPIILHRQRFQLVALKLPPCCFVPRFPHPRPDLRPRPALDLLRRRQHQGLDLHARQGLSERGQARLRRHADRPLWRAVHRGGQSAAGGQLRQRLRGARHRRRRLGRVRAGRLPICLPRLSAGRAGQRLRHDGKGRAAGSDGLPHRPHGPGHSRERRGADEFCGRRGRRAFASSTEMLLRAEDSTGAFGANTVTCKARPPKYFELSKLAAGPRPMTVSVDARFADAETIRIACGKGFAKPAEAIGDLVPGDAWMPDDRIKHGQDRGRSGDAEGDDAVTVVAPRSRGPTRIHCRRQRCCDEAIR